MSPSAASAPERTSRRDRRKLELRERIFETARALFIKKGFEATTLDEIAEQADVARATVCNHFPKKAEFIAEWAALRRREVRATIERGQLAHEGLAVQVLSCFDLLATLNEREPHATRVFCLAWLSNGLLFTEEPVLATIFADMVRHAQQIGEIPADPPATEIGYLLCAGYFDVLRRWVIEPERIDDLHGALRTTATIVLHGVLPR